MSLPERELTKVEIAEEVARIWANPVYGLRLLFPKWFPDEVPWVHWGIISILLRRTDFLKNYKHLDKIIEYFQWRQDPWDEQSEARPMFRQEQDGSVTLILTRHTLIMLPRGFSKTTLLNALIIYVMLFREKSFITYYSDTATHSEKQQQNIRRQFEQNRLIHTLFGNKLPSSDSSNKWNSEIIQTSDNIALKAGGSGTQIRGSLDDGQRPDLMVFDDIEDREEIQNPTQREKIKDWLMKDALPAIARRDPSACAVVLDTLKHSDSAVVMLSKDPRFNTVIFGAKLPNGELLWKEQMGEVELEAERLAFANRGDLSGFYMEYYNKIRAAENAKFKGPFIYSPAEADIVRALAIDPALSADKRACDCVLAVVGMNMKSGKLSVIECLGKRGMNPREQIDNYFMLSKLYNVERHGVEAIGYQAALVHLLREEMFRKKHYFEIEEIKHGKKKEERIEGILQPRYANGYISHVKRFPKLETQLLDWPNGGFDYPDAVAMAIALLDPYAAAAADPEKDLADDEYEPLEQDNYRWA